MITFSCDNCGATNNVEELYTTDTGEWVIKCVCEGREVISDRGDFWKGTK